MHSVERNLVLASIVLMAIFAGLVLYAGVGLGIHLPTHEQHIMPFTEGKVVARENNRFEIYYAARMWSFEPSDLVLPVNADVQIYASSVDVNHGLEVTGTNLNLMVVPGTVNVAHHRFDRKGEYLVVCHEYCGLNHQNMISKIRVVEPQEYTRYVEATRLELSREEEVGHKLADEFQCSGCHTEDGTEGIGPTFKGMFGRKEKLTDGNQITVDDDYVIESVLYPDRKIVEGYERGSMPGTVITPDQMKHLLTYLKSLR
jgi:cytochrome c oxidase subunit 2